MIVYRFGVDGVPLENLSLVMDQMRAAHNYANDLVAIERGRRSALHVVDDTPEVREAVLVVRAATKSTRKAAITALRQARKEARCANPDELARIQVLDMAIRADARDMTDAYWGNYLTVEQSAQQQRSMPLYEDDAITPALPRFRRWREEGQVGIQIQNGLATSVVRACTDMRVRVNALNLPGERKGATEYADLWIRIGSDGRSPIWTRVRTIFHRQVPDAAVWKWVRLSRRREGVTFSWSVEITVDVERPSRLLDSGISGVIAIEPQWIERPDGALICASYRDDKGDEGEVVMPARIVGALRKAADIRAVRDMLLNEARVDVQRLLVEALESLPLWLVEARNTIHLWKSPERFYRLVRRWRGERCDVARGAYDRLQAWELRDDHLWRYEAGSRGQALRSRNDFYHVEAAKWSRVYRHAIVPKRDYSREARFGAESDLRFMCSPSAFVLAIDSGFDHGESAYNCPWAQADADGPEWTAVAIERFGAADVAVVARRAKTDNDSEKKEGAWARRKRLKREKSSALQDAARKPDGNGPESLET